MVKGIQHFVETEDLPQFSQKLDPIVTHSNSDENETPLISMISFEIILPSTSKSPKWSHPAEIL
jgi:hypothetical protein